MLQREGISPLPGFRHRPGCAPRILTPTALSSPSARPDGLQPPLICGLRAAGGGNCRNRLFRARAGRTFGTCTLFCSRAGSTPLLLFGVKIAEPNSLFLLRFRRRRRRALLGAPECGSPARHHARSSSLSSEISSSRPKTFAASAKRRNKICSARFSLSSN